VVILGARKPLTADWRSSIEEACGTGAAGPSLIPTPCEYDFSPENTEKRIIINNTIPEGAINFRFPVCHLLLNIPEDVFRVVFILYLLC
jgi:hypothetical protein